MDYHCQEGSFSLPEGFQDRTVNMFVLGASVPGPLSITLSRDTHLQGEDLADYLMRQLKQLAAKLPGYTVLEQREVVLGVAAPVAGLQIDAYYLNSKRPIHQRQAAFFTGCGRVLVFACTSQADFTAQQRCEWDQLLASFTLRGLDQNDPTGAGEQE
ncbi:DcrB-related protein [Pseudomonas sp. Marseille-Q5115]|uniref:DcrB-related protein n=1 Tax=Pseudomonas sp. Marseille-Q5115 TaxID=2866593 RepID=UPI001CE3B660|nr:DUF1795 domain-containing protein [Pseudomonas sp. Marseille-Q5115]